jgi:hypothetical protein
MNRTQVALQENLKYLSFLIMVRPVMQAMTSLKSKDEQANVNAGTIVVAVSSSSFCDFRCF